MATFAIVRGSGAVDRVEGTSVQEVSDRYGWPGNGNIAPWSDADHASKLRNTFASPAEQYDLWRKVAEKEGQFKKAEDK
jgi:hypothetical protein